MAAGLGGVIGEAWVLAYSSLPSVSSARLRSQWMGWVVGPGWARGQFPQFWQPGRACAAVVLESVVFFFCFCIKMVQALVNKALLAIAFK